MNVTGYSQINRIGLMVQGDIESSKIVGLEKVKAQRLVVRDFADKLIFEAEAPAEGWNFENISKAIAHVDTSDVASLYVGKEMIGSTEL